METGKLEDSERAYQKVVEMAPQHYEARRALSNILHKLGRADEALNTLTQDEKAELLDPTLLYERCQLLLSEGRTEDFVKKAKLLLSRHFVELRSHDEVLALCSSRKYSHKRISELRRVTEMESAAVGSASASEVAFESESSITAQDEYQLMRKLCDTLYNQKRFAELQRVTFSSLGSKMFNKDPEIMKVST